MDEVRAGSITIPTHELDIRFSRSGGPGGQNVNRRDTRVEIVFDVDASQALSRGQKALVRRRLGTRIDRRGRIRVVSSAGRTQRENRVRALDRLGTLLTDALRPPPPPRVASRPSAAARERRIREKKVRGSLKRARGRVETDE